jgi:serine protease Do
MFRPMCPIVLGLSLALSPFSSCNRVRNHPARPPATASSESNPPRSALLPPGGQSIADVAAKVTPSVVNVFSEKMAQHEAPGLSPFFSDPFFDYFFGRGRPGRSPEDAPRRKERSLGSGVIVGSDGLIITNNHVVAQGDKIRVSLNDGREFEAKLVGADAKSDVAVLRVQANDLPAIPVADSSKMRIGDLVLAVGNPFGIGQTVTLGIISAVGRANMGITDYEDFIQTDAAINPGNSGGALVTMDGQLIGINTAIMSRSGGYQGIGFAIPSNMAMQVKDSILKNGRVIRGWLGVSIQDLTDDLSKSLDVPPKSGVLVSDVAPEGPAAKAGLRRGDLISAIDGVRTVDSAHLRNTVALAGKGKTVRIEFLRERTSKSIEVTLGEPPGDGRAAPSVDSSANEGLFAGVSVQALDQSARAQLRIPPNIDGVLITNVRADSPAAAVGLHRGDVIVEVNRVGTPTVEAFTKAAKASERRALLLVYRNGVTIFMSLSR